MRKNDLYDDLGWCYDFITTGEDHEKEADFVKEKVSQYKKTRGHELLDVGCGHGWHDFFLKDVFKITGIDKSRNMLNIARERNPEVDYRQGDVLDFDLNKKFDVVICFDMLQHFLNYQTLKKALLNLQKHVRNGGVLFFYLDEFKENFIPFTQTHTKKVVRGDTEITIVEVKHDSNPEDLIMEDCIVFVIAMREKPPEVMYVKGKTGLFELNRMRRILEELGLQTILYSGDFSGKKYSKKSPFPVFVCPR